REQIRSLLSDLYRGNSKVRGNIFHAMSHVNLDYLPPAIKTSMDDSKDLIESTRDDTYGPEKDVLSH
ncbi:MAG: hypothetical protein WCA08_04685, partial [Desulfoferrobacter sp.]